MTEEKKMVTTATVRVILDIECPQPWNDQATVKEVFEQAYREAEHKLSNLLSAGDYQLQGIRLVKTETRCVSAREPR